MREHAEEFREETLNEDRVVEDDREENLKATISNRGSSPYFREDAEFREAAGPHEHRYRQGGESLDDFYYRDTFINIEDQVETSKLVLQLVTDSRFNMTQINGQRKLGGPPPGWKGPPPGPGCEVFVGKIPRTLYEHEIYPIFRGMGEVYEIRLMMDFSGTNRGYCFVMFGKPEFAQRAIDELDNFEIRPGRRIGVVASINNCRLYVGQLPPDVTSETVIRKIYDITDDVGHVAVYRNANDQARYALISYKTHRGAAMARRRLVPDRASLFGGAEVSIDWAHPSMFPSNVVEDTGICDDEGNIEISRLVVGSESKRCQNRRRVRDDFLDHSIRAYLQTDRAMENSTRNKHKSYSSASGFSSKNDHLNHLNSLSGITRGINNFLVFDQNSNSKSANYCQSNDNYSRGEKNHAHIEIPRKSKDSNNSSFDINVCSGSSESSGCSSQSSASEKLHHNLSKEFSDSAALSDSFHSNSQILRSVDKEEDIFSDGDKIIPGQIFGSSRSTDLGGKKGPESLNLFDNYTFSGNCREIENHRDFNKLQLENNPGTDFSSEVFHNDLAIDQERKIYGAVDFFQVNPGGDKFLLKISGKESEIKREHKSSRENERKSRDQRVVHKSIKSSNSKLQNFQGLDISSKTIGSPFKNENFKSPCGTLNSHNFSRPQSRNAMSSFLWNKNSKNLSSARLVAENCLMQQQQQLFEQAVNRFPKNANSSTSPTFPNPRNFTHNNTNFNAIKRAAWLTAQAALNGYDLSSNNLGANISSVNNSIVYSADSEYPGGFISSGTPSQFMNFYPTGEISAANFAQNVFSQNTKKIANCRNGPKTGRPILSRSYL